jgi:hypothetical protein
VKKTTVSLASVGVVEETVLPVRVQEALGELVGAAKEGLLALSVGVGLGVLAELMEEEVDEVVGPKGRHDPERTAVRHGREAGEVTLGGRRVALERPRVRSADGTSELPMQTYAHFADRDPLTAAVLERMLAGVSTRDYRRVQEPVGEGVEAEARSTSKSAVSRQFVARTRENLEALMHRRLDDVRLAVLMLDGIDLKGRTNVVALGISTDGVKIPLGLWEGSTENAAVATALLSDLVDRGLDVEQGVPASSTAPKRCARLCVTCWALARRCNAVSVTRREMSAITWPSVTAPLSSNGSAPPGASTITPSRSSVCERWPASSTAPIPVPPPRCAKAWRRRSRCSGSGSAAASSRRSRPRTRASR